MNVDKFAIHGTYETQDGTPVRALVMPLLPADGSYAITGTIVAVEDVATRQCVAFYPRFLGIIVAGTATDSTAVQTATDGAGVQATAPSSRTAVPASGTSPPQVIVTGRQLEVLLTGAQGKTVQWAWDLELVTLSVPGFPTAPTGPIAGPKPVTPVATTATTTNPTVGERRGNPRDDERATGF